MSVVKFEDKKDKELSSWTKRNRKAVQHGLPKDTQKPVIDYDRLRWLCEIDGLKDRHNKETTEEAHRVFMENYKTVFVGPEPKTGFPSHSLARSIKKSSESSIMSKSVGGNTPAENRQPIRKEYPIDTITHEIKDYLPLLHKERKSENPHAVRAERIATLRRCLKKLPFERSAAENDQIFHMMRHFSSLSSQVSPRVLKELCVVAQLDSWKDPGITMFGNTGYHLILKGSVRPQTDPWYKSIGEVITLRSPTPVPDYPVDDLRVGECFGTLEKITGRNPNSKVLTVETLEACEFMKVSCSDYTRVIEQIRQRDETEKVNLLQTCSGYKLWSKQPLVKVANLIEWASFPANTVLVSEGYTSPFLGIIKSGECHVLRQVEVLQDLPNGKKEKKVKQVVMGKLGQSDTFGEISIILDEPITCSIVTASVVELGCIKPEKLRAEVDEVTLQLLQQSSQRTYGNVTLGDIHEEYVQQELKREWNEFKHNAVVDVINSRGIRPGYGKWSK